MATPANDSLHQSEGTSASTWEVCQSNKIFNLNVDSYPLPQRITVTALLHSQLKEVLTIYAVVPTDLIIEAFKTYKQIDDKKFGFRLFGISWKISLSRFCTWLKIPLYDEIVTPTTQDLYDMVNQMGHEPVIYSSSDFYSSKLPEHWVPLYHAVVSLSCKNSGSAKINKTQLMIMYALVMDAHVEVGKSLFECFLTVMGARKADKIVCHRFWSVIISNVIADHKHVVEEGAVLMPVATMSIPLPRKSSQVFTHPGFIPQSMLLRIPKDNPVLLAHNGLHRVITPRVYDLTKFQSEKQPQDKGKKKAPAPRKTQKKKKLIKKAFEVSYKSKGKKRKNRDEDTA